MALNKEWVKKNPKSEEFKTILEQFNRQFNPMWETFLLKIADSQQGRCPRTRVHFAQDGTKKDGSSRDKNAVLLGLLNPLAPTQ